MRNRFLPKSLLILLLLFTLPNAAFALTPFLDLSSPDPESGRRFGRSVGGIEDVNGSGYRDILVGERLAVYVFEGSTGALIRKLTVASSENPAECGSSLSSVPDVDGDGIDDIVVGDYDARSITGLDHVGRAFLFSGQTGTLLHRFDSPNPILDARFGNVVQGIPDVTGDGRGEVVIGSPQEGAYGKQYGAVYVFNGSTGALLHSLNPTSPKDGGRFGDSIAFVPDLTGDGITDMVIGAPNEGSDPNTDGRVYVFDGVTGILHDKLFLAEINYSNFGQTVAGLEDITGDSLGELVVGAGGAGRAYIIDGVSKAILRTLTSPHGHGEFGSSVSVLNDLNNNQTQEVLVGAYYEEFQGVTGAGGVHLFDSVSGSLVGSANSPNPETSGIFGYTLASVDDINGDGRTDFIVGAPQEDPGISPGNSGKAYVYLGLFPKIAVDPDSLPFGEIEEVSGQSKAVAVTIANEGTQDLVIPCPGIYLAGPDTDDFIIEGLDWHCATGPNASSIPPGASQSLTVYFQPSSLGVKNATLVIESDDPFAPVVEVPLSGTGIPQAPLVSIEPSNPKTLEDLTAVITPASRKGTVNYEFQWHEDGEVLVGEASATLDDALTTRDRVYLCEVRAEESGFRSPIASASVTIRNSTPTEPEVEILPPDPVPNEELAVKIGVDSTDDDGDIIVYLFRWFESSDGVDWRLRSEVSGTLYPYFRGLPVVSALYTQAADFWMVEVTPIEAQTLKKKVGPEKGSATPVVGPSASDAVFVMPDLDGDLTVSNADLLDLLNVWHKRKDELPEGMRPMFFDQGDPEDAQIGVRHLYSIGLTGWYWSAER